MITDPWSLYGLEHDWEARIDRLDRRLQCSLALHCVDHALEAIPLAGQGLLGRARQALMEGESESEAWLSQLQLYAEQVAEAPGPQDPPVRAIDALVHACAGLAANGSRTREALYHAFWALAEAVCPTDDWVSELLGRSDLMEELDAQIGSCWQAFRELGYQAAALKRLEREARPLARREAVSLAEEAVLDGGSHAQFARAVYRQALANLRQSPAADLPYLRVLLRGAAFEQALAETERAAEFYRQALAALQLMGKVQAAAVVRRRLERLESG